MSRQELDVLGLDSEDDLSTAIDAGMNGEIRQLNSATHGSAEAEQELPRRDLEVTAEDAFAILDRGKKGFFTAKDVEYCCQQAGCKVFGSSNIPFRVSHYMNRAFPKADPGSITLEDFKEEWNDKPGSAFRVLIFKYQQKGGNSSKPQERRHSDSDNMAPVHAYRNFQQAAPRRTSAPTQWARRRVSDPYEAEAEADEQGVQTVPPATKLGSVSYKSRHGRKEAVLHDDGIRILGPGGRVYLHVTEWVRTAPYSEIYEPADTDTAQRLSF